MKIAVIGGGSTYTPELVNGFLARINQFPLAELGLMDIDAKRLAVVGGLAQRMAAAKGAPFQVILSTNQRETIKGAAYVTTQLRGGHLQARRFGVTSEIRKVMGNSISMLRNMVVR